MIWSNGSLQQLADILGNTKHNNDLTVSASSIFVIFGVKQTDIRFNPYVQIFDPDELVARVGAAGVFGNQIIDKEDTFITCECPANVSDLFWAGAERYVEKIWNCLERYALISPIARYQWVKIIRVPKTITFQKVGFTELNSQFAHMLAERYKSLFFRTNPLNSRRDIFHASFDVLDFVGQ